VYIPDELPILAARKLPHKEPALPAEITELDHLKSRLEAPQNSFDVDTLFHIQQATLRQKNQQHWHQIVAAVSCCSYRPTDSLFFHSVKALPPDNVLFSHEQLAEIKHHNPTFVFFRFYIRAPENHCKN
jgi:hypothetical protein